MKHPGVWPVKKGLPFFFGGRVFSPYFFFCGTTSQFVKSCFKNEAVKIASAGDGTVVKLNCVFCLLSPNCPEKYPE